MMADIMIFDWADNTVNDDREKREALEYKGIKHESYLAFAKTLIQDVSEPVGQKELATIFKHKWIKMNLLAALADNLEEFPELQRDLTNTSLYYLFSLRDSGFGKNEKSKSLQELRAIQAASKEKRISDVAVLVRDKANVWSDYEFVLRYERAAGDKQQYRGCYQQALLHVLTYMETASQKARFFLKAYGEGLMDKALYQAMRGEIKEAFRSKMMSDRVFEVVAEKLLADQRHRELIELVAAADRRTFFKKYVLSNPLVLDCVNDEQKGLFSQDKLRPLLGKTNEQKRSFFSGGSSFFSFSGLRVRGREVEMGVVKVSGGVPNPKIT